MILVSKTQRMLHHHVFGIIKLNYAAFFNAHVSILPCFETILLYALVQL